MAENKKEKPTEKYVPTCFWKPHWDGSYYIGCRDFRMLAHCRQFSYCPYCGRKLEISSI